MPKSETPDENGRLSDQDQVAHDDAAARGAADEPAGSGREGGGEGARWRLSNWPLRYKMAVVLIVPLLTAVIFGGLRAGESLSDAGELSDGVDQIRVAESVAVLMHEIQRERTLMVTSMTGASIGSEDVDRQKVRVDDAVRALSEVADAEDGDSAGAASFSHGLQRLSALREKIENTPLPALSAYTIYNSIIESLVGQGRANPLVADQELLRRSDLVRNIDEIKEYTARQNAVLQMAVGHGEFVSDLLDRARSAGARADASVEALIGETTIGEQELYLDSVSGAEVDNRERLITTAYNGAAGPGGLGINGSQLRADSIVTVDKMRAVEIELLNRLKEHNEGLAADATTTAWVFLGITLATLIAAIVFTLMVARALSRPLRSLRSTALEVAYVRLPEAVRRILADPNPIEASRKAIAPVPVHTREEIGELARSFDVVHERAIRLAAEQALLRENVNGIFVNLSRRSQRLVERQLGIIDRLESDEQDPDQLASLFELDHLATRLRRNGESLLVLSGAGLTKSMSKPVPAADVIGAAVSEIEQYSRVELGTIPEVSVHGRAVHDLVHLLAELLDNATYFSEPETAISVRAVVTRRNSLAVQITDRGVGMSDQQLTEANDRLADPPDLDVSVTRRMGLYVVARLAKRHGIEVRLRENEDIEGGVIARVVVPTNLLTGAVRPTGTTATVPPYHSRAGTSGPSHAEVSSPSLFPSTPDIASGGVAPGTTIPPLPAPRGSAEHDRPGGTPGPGDHRTGAEQTDTKGGNPVDPGAGIGHGGLAGKERNGHSPYDGDTNTTERPAPPAVGPADAAPVPTPVPTPDPSGPDGAVLDSAVSDGCVSDGAVSDSAAPDRDQEGGLRPLDEPISLDDLIGGRSPAAGPFLTPATDDETVPESDREFGRGSGGAEPVTEFVSRPVDEPLTELVRPTGATPPGPDEPLWPAESPDGEVTDGSALEDDAPTRRLPIYQSVLSRWFSEDSAFEPDDDHGADDHGAEASGEPLAGGPAGGTTSDGHGGTKPVDAAMTDGSRDDAGSDGAAGARDGGVDGDWHSASDLGWQAAHALLEDKNEELTPAGLPKRVPNAYLVPGSVGAPSKGDGFTDTTVGEPGQGAIARSAEAARSRMKSFQRGYQSGRHALNEPQVQSEQVDETGATPRSNGAKE